MCTLKENTETCKIKETNIKLIAILIRNDFNLINLVKWMLH